MSGWVNEGVSERVNESVGECEVVPLSTAICVCVCVCVYGGGGSVYLLFPYITILH